MKPPSLHDTRLTAEAIAVAPKTAAASAVSRNNAQVPGEAQPASDDDADSALPESVDPSLPPVLQCIQQRKWPEALRLSEDDPEARADVIRHWASSLGGVEAMELLQKHLGLQEALEYALRHGMHERALALMDDEDVDAQSVQVAPEIHLRFALYLEDRKRFLEAEDAYCKAGRPEEAVNMFLHVRDLPSAVRLASRNPKCMKLVNQFRSQHPEVPITASLEDDEDSSEHVPARDRVHLLTVLSTANALVNRIKKKHLASRISTRRRSLGLMDTAALTSQAEAAQGLAGADAQRSPQSPSSGDDGAGVGPNPSTMKSRSKVKMSSLLFGGIHDNSDDNFDVMSASMPHSSPPIKTAPERARAAAGPSAVVADPETTQMESAPSENQQVFGDSGKALHSQFNDGPPPSDQQKQRTKRLLARRKSVQDICGMTIDHALQCEAGGDMDIDELQAVWDNAVQLARAQVPDRLANVVAVLGRRITQLGRPQVSQVWRDILRQQTIEIAKEQRSQEERVLERQLEKLAAQKQREEDRIRRLGLDPTRKRFQSVQTDTEADPFEAPTWLGDAVTDDEKKLRKTQLRQMEKLHQAQIKQAERLAEIQKQQLQQLQAIQQRQQDIFLEERRRNEERLLAALAEEQAKKDGTWIEPNLTEEEMEQKLEEEVRREMGLLGNVEAVEEELNAMHAESVRLRDMKRAIVYTPKVLHDVDVTQLVAAPAMLVDDLQVNYDALFTGRVSVTPPPTPHVPDPDLDNLPETELARLKRLVQLLSTQDGAATLIKAVYRGYKVRMVVPFFLQQHRSAVRIQAAYRGYRSRKQMTPWLREQRAAVKIQTRWRMFVARQEVAELRVETAAEKIQSCWRGHLGRLEYREVYKQHAANVIKGSYRGMLARRELRSRMALLMIELEFDAARYLRTVWLGYLGRKAAREQRRCVNAVVLTRVVRGFLGRQQFKHQAIGRHVTKIAAAWRGLQVRRRLQRERIATAATTIQRVVLGFLARSITRRIPVKIAAATRISSTYRGYAVRHRKSIDRRFYEGVRKGASAVQIQAAWRGYAVRHRAFLDQKHACWQKVEQARIQAAKEEAAAVTLQAFWRGWVVREGNRQAAVVVQLALQQRQRDERAIRLLVYVIVKKAINVAAASEQDQSKSKRFRKLKSFTQADPSSPGGAPLRAPKAVGEKQRTARETDAVLDSANALGEDEPTEEEWGLDESGEPLSAKARRKTKKQASAARKADGEGAALKPVAEAGEEGRDVGPHGGDGDGDGDGTAGETQTSPVKRQVSDATRSEAQILLEQKKREVRAKLERENARITRIPRAVARIAAAWVGFGVRQNVRMLRDSTIRIQSLGRGYLGRRYCHELIRQLTKIQALFRGVLGRRAARRVWWAAKLDDPAANRSAAKIQALYRGRKQRGALERWNRAAALIQLAWKNYKRLLEMQVQYGKAVAKLQAWFLGARVRLRLRRWKLSVAEIQRVARGLLVRKMLRGWHASAVKIQARFRGKLTRDRIHNEKILPFVVRIQSHWRMFVAIRKAALLREYYIKALRKRQDMLVQMLSEDVLLYKGLFSLINEITDGGALQF